MGDRSRQFFFIVGGDKIKIEFGCQLMSEEEKIKIKKLIGNDLIPSENWYFLLFCEAQSIEERGCYGHVGGKNNKKALMATFFPCQA